MDKGTTYQISKASLLAALLYVKGPKGQIAEGIVGKTRLMKLMFLTIKEGKLENVLSSKSDFKPYKYGPFDVEIYDVIDSLESMKIIYDINDTIKYNAEQYDKTILFKLTDKGIEKTKAIIDKMPYDTYRTIERIKRIYARMPLTQLLHYVYSKYSEYAVNSELHIF